MNRRIQQYGYPITALVLLIFAWVVAQRLARGVDAIIPLAVAAVVAWAAAVAAFVWFWPRITVNGFKRAILGGGFGGGPIPINALRAVAGRPSDFAETGSLMATGTDDLIYLGGWLDLSAGPRVLHVPEMHGRYYSVQLTDPASGANVAYVGKRTTGTQAGAFAICAGNWRGRVPEGIRRIDVPGRSALVSGRVFAADDSDRAAAYQLASEIQLTPLDRSP